MYFYNSQDVLNSLPSSISVRTIAEKNNIIETA